MKILWRYRNWTVQWDAAWQYGFTFVNVWVAWKLRIFNVTILGLSIDNAYEGKF